MTHRIPTFTGLADQRAAAYDAASREWQRLARLPHDARLTLVADTVWNHGYRTGFGNSAARVVEQVRLIASRVADSLAQQGPESKGAPQALGHLATVADDPLPPPSAPPTAVETLTVALADAATLTDRRSDQRVADLAWPDALRAGGAAGIVTTAADVLIEWRRLLGTTRLAQTRIQGRPIVDWAEGMLRYVMREAAAGEAWSTTSHGEWLIRLRDRTAGADPAKTTTLTQRSVRASQGFTQLTLITGDADRSATTGQTNAARPPRTPGRRR